MREFFKEQPRIFQRAEFLSPKDLLQRACAISAVFLLLHLVGLREFTSVLNGTVGSVALGWKLSGVLAVVYIIFYLGFVVLVPILILAALFLLVWQNGWKRNRQIQPENSNESPTATPPPN